MLPAQAHAMVDAALLPPETCRMCQHLSCCACMHAACCHKLRVSIQLAAITSKVWLLLTRRDAGRRGAVPKPKHWLGKENEEDD